MQTSADIGALAAALAKAQGAIKNASKDAANTFYRASYAPLDTVIDAIKAALASNEIAVVQSPRSDGGKVSLTTRLLHASGQWLETDSLEATAKDAGPQAIGSTVTYLRRYSLMAAVGIAASDDDDAEAGSGRTEPQKPAPRRETKPAPAGPKPSSEQQSEIKQMLVRDMAAVRSRKALHDLVPMIRQLSREHQAQIKPLYDSRWNALEGTEEPDPADNFEQGRAA